jgi:hypothetical protein
MSHLLDSLQGLLNFSGCKGRQFVDSEIGKIGVTGFIIGLVGGVHLGVVVCCVGLYVSGLVWSGFLSALVRT